MVCHSAGRLLALPSEKTILKKLAGEKHTNLFCITIDGKESEGQNKLQRLPLAIPSDSTNICDLTREKHLLGLYCELTRVEPLTVLYFNSLAPKY